MSDYASNRNSPGTNVVYPFLYRPKYEYRGSLILSDEDQKLWTRLVEICTEFPKPSRKPLSEQEVSFVRFLNECGMHSIKISRLIPCGYYTIRDIISGRTHVGRGMFRPENPPEAGSASDEQPDSGMIEVWQKVIDECNDLNFPKNRLTNVLLDDGTRLSDRAGIKAHAVNQLKRLIEGKGE